jgi:uncharacterized protein DUF2846
MDASRTTATLLCCMLGLGLSELVAKDHGEEKPDDEGYVQFEKAHPLGQVDPDKALVYVVRPTSMGFAIKSWFLCDDQALGVNRGSSYFFAHIDPGKHLFWSKSENVDALELEVEAGKTYYLQQHVKIGGLKARTKLEALDEATGTERLAKCSKHGVLTESGKTRGAEIASEYKKHATEDLARKD